jgi:non-specific serine/threonine protein kinase
LQGVLGYVASTRGDHQRAKELFEEELRLYRRTGDEWGVAGSLNALALVWSNLGNVARAKELYEEALALGRELLGRELGDVSSLITSLVDLGYVLLLEGNIERAEALNEEAAVLTREHGHRASLAVALDNLGWTALLRGDLESSETLHKESLILCNEYGNKFVASGSLDGLACAAGARGDSKRAARLFGAARTLLEMVGYHLAPAEQALLEPYLTDVRSRQDEESWEAAFAEGQAMTFEEAIEYALSDGGPDASASPILSLSPTYEPVSALTRREREVAALVARGLTNRQVSQELSISERTAGNHVAKILKKLGLHSRSQIASWGSETQSPTSRPD